MSFSRYESYKDSGVEWLGEVPEHWVITRLKSVLSEPLMYGANQSAEGDNPENPRFIRITDIVDNNTLRDDTFRSLSPEVAAPYILNDGDVLLARSGATVGKSFIYKAELGKCCFAGYLIRAKLNGEKIAPSFFYACCQTKFYWQFINGNQIQATIQNVSAEKYVNFSFPCPPLSEQQTIAAFLDRETAKIDALIAEQQRLIELLKEKRQSVISHAVTKGLNPNAPMKDSGIEWLGEVPGHWNFGRLAYMCELLVDGTHHSPESHFEGEYLYVTAKNIKEHGFDFSDITYVSLKDHQQIFSRCPVQKGDVLYIKDGATAGIAMVNYLDQEFSLLSSVALIRPLTFIINPHFLAYHLNASQFKTDALNKLNGSAMTRFTIDLISRFVISIPPIEEQGSVAIFLDRETAKLDTLTAEAKTAITLLQERRTALISATVTGKIDVRGLVAAKTEVKAGSVPC